MKAMILAAGEGIRLKPLTLETPKVLLPVGGVPLIEHTLVWLRSHGVSEVAINLCHLGDKIRDFLGDGSRLGVSITYSFEEKLLGTAGGVKKLERFFDGTFVVVCGDILTDFDLAAMAGFHQARGSAATLAVLQVADPRQYGIVSMDRRGRVLSFVEKPPPGSEAGKLGSAGVYILGREVLDYIPGQCFADFARDVFPEIIELGVPVYGYHLKAEDYLLDIGTIERYRQANEDVKAGKVAVKRGR